MVTQGKRSNRVEVPQRAWWGDTDAVLDFPDDWEVTVYPMNGHGAPALTEDGFRQAFANPIGSRPIRELARGKKNVVVLFDDMSRPTRTYQIIPFLLEELAAAGVERENIQFICAPGTHGALTAWDFARKLGEDTIARFDVYNHNIYENLTYVGDTSRGTSLSLNAEFMKADLKIGVGAILPHANTGYGGGGKLILPGIASLESVLYNHREVRTRSKETGIDGNTGIGRYENNAQLLDTIEACQMSGLHVKIDAFVNMKRDTTALFVGEPIAEFYEGARQARQHYYSATPDHPDVVIANCNAKVNEAVIGKTIAQELLPDSGGTLVLLTDNPWGEVCHYLRRKSGHHTAGQGRREPTLSPKVKKFIIQMPHKNLSSIDWIAPAEAVTWTRTWEEVIAALREEHPDGARVAVIPDATIQLFDVIATLYYL